MTTPVRFAAVNGSIGLADEIEGRVYVTWCYGKAADGSPILGHSNYADYSQLVQIPHSLYDAYIAQEAWSEGQHLIERAIDAWLDEKTKREKIAPTGVFRRPKFNAAPDCVCPCPPCFCRASEKKS